VRKKLDIYGDVLNVALGWRRSREERLLKQLLFISLIVILILWRIGGVKKFL
jgi:hypothetical protein